MVLPPVAVTRNLVVWDELLNPTFGLYRYCNVLRIKVPDAMKNLPKSHTLTTQWAPDSEQEGMVMVACQPHSVRSLPCLPRWLCSSHTLPLILCPECTATLSSSRTLFFKHCSPPVPPSESAVSTLLTPCSTHLSLPKSLQDSSDACRNHKDNSVRIYK